MIKTPNSALSTITSRSFDLWEDTTETAASYASFRSTYRHLPDRFVVECIDFNPGESPAPYQLESLVNLYTHKRACVRGPHGLGKSAMMSWALLHFALTNDIDHDWKIATTASVWRQLKKFLWPEIHKWSKRIKWNMVGREPIGLKRELFDMFLRLSTGEAFAMASDDSESMEGAHASKVLVIFDESKIILPETWDSVEGAFSTGDAYWFACSTPGAPSGRFYDIQKRKPGYSDWWIRHVTKDEMIDSGRMNIQWAEDRKMQWGEHSARYQNRVLGQFAASEEESVIPLYWVELANKRWYDRFQDNPSDYLEQPLTGVGVDVGGGTQDPSAIAYRHGNDIYKVERLEKNVEVLSGKVTQILKSNEFCNATIDSINIGAGTYLRNRELYPNRVYAFTASATANWEDETGEYIIQDTRSAAWWNLRQILNPESGMDVALPPDDDLTGELCAPTWEEVGRAGIKVESKKKIRARIGKSTNLADAVVQVYWESELEWGMDSW
jgi:hypothetical protein